MVSERDVPFNKGELAPAEKRAGNHLTFHTLKVSQGDLAT